MLRKLTLGAGLTALLASAPAVAADDWFRRTQGPNWWHFEGTLDLNQKPYAIVVGRPGSVEGNIVAAAIPREGPLEWSNYLFDCKAGTGRVLQVWQTDRAGVSKDLGSVDGDYLPIEEDTIVGHIMAVACGNPTPYFTPITGDVLAAADAELAVAR
jgi:hypothetical protein